MRDALYWFGYFDNKTSYQKASENRARMVNMQWLLMLLLLLVMILMLRILLLIVLTSLIVIYFTTITKQVIQLILSMLVGTDVCVRMVFVWEESGVPGGNMSDLVTK